MTDTLTPEKRSENMRNIRSKDMKPELAVRRIVHAMRYRYRLHGKGLSGKPDLVFAGRKKVIFVHGCFWHRHGNPACKIARLPKSNLDFWLPKLERTQARDVASIEKLRQAGWEVLVVWECQIKNTESLRSTLRAFLEGEIA